MKIKYNLKNSMIRAMVGVILIALGSLSVYYGSGGMRFSFVLGGLYLAIYFYRKYFYYVTIENGAMKKDFGPRILLSDVILTNRMGEDYIFKTKTKKLTINKETVDKDSIAEIERLIDALRDGESVSTEITNDNHNLKTTS